MRCFRFDRSLGRYKPADQTEAPLHIHFDEATPIYLQIIDEFRRQIGRGALGPGERIPSHRELAQQIKVNPNTIQRAYREMEAAGLVETLRGQGTFVRGDPSLVAEIREEMARRATELFVRERRSLGLSDREIASRLAAGLAARGSSAKGGDR